MVSKKEVCLICKRKLRLRCFVYNKLKKKLICRRCDKRIGSNKFYIPQKKYDNKGKVIGKYTMTDTEKTLLRKRLIDSGMSFRQANYEIGKKVNYLKDMKRRNQAKAIQYSYQRQEAKKKQEAFVEGLR